MLTAQTTAMVLSQSAVPRTNENRTCTSRKLAKGPGEQVKHPQRRWGQRVRINQRGPPPSPCWSQEHFLACGFTEFELKGNTDTICPRCQHGQGFLLSGKLLFRNDLTRSPSKGQLCVPSGPPQEPGPPPPLPSFPHQSRKAQNKPLCYPFHSSERGGDPPRAQSSPERSKDRNPILTGGALCLWSSWERVGLGRHWPLALPSVPTGTRGLCLAHEGLQGWQ